MRIHQIVPSTSSWRQLESAFVLLPLFRSVDPDSSVYGADLDDVDRDVDGKTVARGDLPSIHVRPLHALLAALRERVSESLVVVHAGAIPARVIDALMMHAQQLVVVAGDGIGDDGATQTLLFDAEEGGRRLAAPVQMQRLASRAARAVAFSVGSAELLKQHGFADVVVCPPIVDPTVVVSTQPHAPTVNHFETMIAGKLFVALDGVSPVSRSELIVQAYHVVSTYLDPTAHLALVGPQQPRYSECIEHEINELNLNRAWIAGDVDVTERRVYLDNASVAVATRVGEADHASLLEAMQAGVPIVATEARGLRELCADSALVLPENADATLIAEAIVAAATDMSLREEMMSAGRACIAGHAFDVALARVADAIFEVAAR